MRNGLRFRTAFLFSKRLHLPLQLHETDQGLGKTKRILNSMALR